MTVREALEFSALMRQSAEVPRQDKFQYVEHVISMLEMQEFAGAVIRVLGEGLNIEQRKRLTIGVELAAGPQLLVFFDEPTSGLDSQTLWVISVLIKKLASSGQAVLCMIHQPSAILFDQFDRLLLIAPGGKTVYFGGEGIRFLSLAVTTPLWQQLSTMSWATICCILSLCSLSGFLFLQFLLYSPTKHTLQTCLLTTDLYPDIGDKSSTLINYFERNGAPKIETEANPAEWMLQVIKPPQEGSGNVDWHEIWRNSPEYKGVKKELNRLRALAPTQHHPDSDADQGSQHQEFVSSFLFQFWEVLIRTSKHFWRSPVYMWSKITLITLSSLYLGFSYTATNSVQGLQNQLWAIFLLLVLFININEQIMPMFVPQRALYESRERPSKIYRWSTYVLSNILVEILWNSVMAAVMFVCWYYPVGFVRNTTDEDRTVRGFLVFLFLWTYLLFTSTFAHFAIVWIDLPETAGALTSLFWMLCILFCGVGVPKVDLPAFWRFMYRVSPATYLVGGIMTTAVANTDVVCADYEILHVSPPVGGNVTCGDFLGPFAKASGGRVLNTAELDVCGYCPVATTNDFLAQFDLSYDTRWRDFGLMWVYVIFNIAAAMGLYWVFRVPKGKETKTK
ncbi:multidrug resistance protein cdr1 [Colletotrichum incanum]|uniref:Multidrug resistance protein cdr1 n=1 Tax=Colletotrichum incanum TaxID=1573173 RepID=A0A167EAZ7_COLIC|nr:multidrug resistance protein cdr1 [Colletotrichum incanum]